MSIISSFSHCISCMTESTVNHHVTVLWQIVLTYCSSLLLLIWSTKTETCFPIERATSHTVTRCCEAQIWQRGTRTQCENVSATGPGHMVLLDGLVERGLAQQQEAEANPHGQQPGHGKAKSAGQHLVGGGRGNRDRIALHCVSKHIHNTHCVFNSLGKRKDTSILTYSHITRNI